MKVLLQYVSKSTVYKHVAIMTVLFSVLLMNARAQIEPMFTQYMFNETFINPAYTGSHENLSTTLLYRDQWVGIAGAPKTQTLSIHSPIDKRRLAIGLSVMNDNIGVSHQLYVSAAFAYRILFPHSTLAFGASGGFVNDEELFTELHPITAGDNQFLYNSRKLFLPNAGFGMYYYNQRFYAGLSIPRLFENNISTSPFMAPEKNSLDFNLWNYYLATGYVFDLSDEVKFKPSVMVKTVLHAPVELDMDVNFLFNDFLWLGGGYRTGDAVFGMVGLQLSKLLRIGYSYDYTLSALQTYTSGTHELTLQYDINLHKNSTISTRYF